MISSTADYKMERNCLEMLVDQNEYDALLEQLKWTHALLAIMVENEGGVVQISQEVVETYNLNNQLQVTFDEVSLSYVISSVIEGEVVA